MTTRTRSARAARRILSRYKIREPAVPVERIARKFACIVREDLPDGIAGMLVPLPPTSPRPWTIVVNGKHPSVRQRFTIAHELGHIVLHRYDTPHADADFRVRFRNEASSQGSVREEIEANRFAAELLMPEDLVGRELEKIGFDYSQEMTARLAVKLRRLAIRFE